MRVLRSSLLVAAAAFVAAACGDKVNVVQPSNSAITSVQVAPSTATISVGQSVTLTAAVNAAAGVTPTVTWSTSSSAAATVSQSGVVVGVASSPGVAICATATSGTQSLEGCATVVVQPASTVTPAVLQIASITVAGNLNAPVPTPPGAVVGQINVSVNVNPGTEKMDSVVVMVNGKSAASQSFTSAQAAALRSAANAADQALQSTIVFPINTAAYNATTGAVTYPNGTSTISVVGYGHQGASAATNTTTQGVPLLFGNADAWVVSQTIGTTKTANDAAGFAHTTGSVTVSAVPVLYSGLAIGTASVNFGTAACDASGSAQRTQALTAPAAGTFAWTATFADAAQSQSAAAIAAAANLITVNSYEFNGAASVACGNANAAGGEGAVIAASQYTNTNSGPAGAGSFALGSTTPLVRLDNRAPANVVPTLLVGGRTNNWVNDALNLVGTQTAAQAAAGGTAVVTLGAGAGQLQDQGVGLAATPVVATVTGGNLAAATPLTNSTTLNESANNTTYTAVYTYVDALGNTSTPAAAEKPTFGVDRTAPVLVATVQPGNGKAFAADPATGFQFAATDNATPPAAPSGFFNLAAAPLTMTEMSRNSTASLWWCPSTGVYQKTTVACPNTLVLPANNGWIGTTQNFMANLNTADNGIGNNYFTTTAVVADQAGNVSTGTFTNNVFAVDAVAPVIGGIGFPPFFTAGGSATFTSAITTAGLDIALSRMNLSYGAPGLNLFDGNTGAAFAPTSAAGGARLWQPDVVVDAYNAATLQTSAPFTVTVNPVLTNVQAATASAGTNPAAVGVALTSVNAFALNQPLTSSAVSTAAITGASLPAAAAITNTGLAGAGPVNWLICGTGAACASPPAALAAATFQVSRTGIAPAVGITSVSITAVAEGTTAVFNNPFSSVQFWAYDPAAANEGWRLISTVTNSSTVTDGGAAVPNGRNWQFTTTWTPTLTTAPDNGIYKVMAIGIGGTSLPAAQQGMALASPLGGITVTVNP